MIDNKITRELLESGQIKNVLVLTYNSKYIKCRISKLIKNGEDFILKLKTNEDYPLAHKYIYRSIEEVF